MSNSLISSKLVGGGRLGARLMAMYYAQCRIPTDGLVFHASLNGQTPGVAETGQTLTTTGTVTYGKFHGIPCALEWSETAFLSFADTGLPSRGEARTLSMWAGSRSMLGYGKNASRALCYLYRSNTAVGFNTSGNNVGFGGSVSGDLTHVCVVLSGRDVALYVGGRYIATQTLASAPATVIGQGRIGCYAGTSTDYYHGFTAACRIYSRALSEREILVLSHEFHPQEV